MADQIRELKDKAQALTAKGKLPAAIEAWQRVLAASPDELVALQKIGDLQAKNGQKPEAIATYERLADRYATNGLFFKASAVCRLVLALDPTHSKIQAQIASLFARAKAPPPPLLANRPSPPSPQAAPTAAPPPPPADAIEADFDVEIEVEPPETLSGLPSIPLFSTLTAEELKEILSTAMEVRSFAAGEALVREGAPGDSMFALAEGDAGVFRGWKTEVERRVATAQAGEILGEVALLTRGPRLATVVADTDCVALEIRRDAMAKVVRRFPHVGVALNQFHRERLLANALRATPVLRAMSEPDKRALALAFKPCTFADGVKIIAEGDAPEAVHMLLRGTCAVSHQSGARYPDMHEGDLFGELSVLMDKPATATVSALGPALTLKIPGDTFKALVLRDPTAALAVKKVAAQRLARTLQLDRRHGAAAEPDTGAGPDLRV
ncbi:MAG: cyclic nucleotide-binding domain-containing protein [Myxococcaceae bacterium]|nr:cyclic nucleotide-binding domain-containing protein [Myxococcaceae bacterium]